MRSPILAVLASAAASAIIGLWMLFSVPESDEGPGAIMFAAFFLQPAVLMLLSGRKASMDVAAGVIALILGVGLVWIPYALIFPPIIVAAMLSVVAGILAFSRNPYSTAKCRGWLALLAVVLTATAMAAPAMVDFLFQFRCRTGPIPLVCVTGSADTYGGAVAVVAALWIGGGVLWLVSRKLNPELGLPALER